MLHYKILMIEKVCENVTVTNIVVCNELYMQYLSLC
jgi:hypothetical protein